MASIRRFDRYTELGPYVAWLCGINDGEYTVAVQIAGHTPESEDGTFETEELALAAADALAHNLQRTMTIPLVDQPPAAPVARP